MRGYAEGGGEVDRQTDRLKEPYGRGRWLLLYFSFILAPLIHFRICHNVFESDICGKL